MPTASPGKSSTCRNWCGTRNFSRLVPEEDNPMKKTTVFAALILAAAPAAAQQPGVTADKILLGQAAVFTGPAAQLGIQMRNGIKSYFDFVNEKGGVHGRK